MPSMLLSRRDLAFQLYEWLDVETLTQRPRFADHSRETFDATLDTSERMATELFATHNKKNDQQEPHFDGEHVHIIPEVKTALDAFSASGLIASSRDYEVGGMQLPTVIGKACFGMFTAANCGTASYPFLTVANTTLLLAHGTPAQIDTFAKPQLEGRWFGTMCLSEPQAGSSLSDIVTRAQADGDSPFGPQYRLTGNKMWISAGEHELSDNIVHLVLAKIPGPDGKLIPGVKGISLFIVPKFIVDANGARGEHNDVVLAGLNHKMGYRGTTNCLLNFGEGTKYRPGGKSGAIGYLVGEPHKGLSAMFVMMNEMRIGVGMGAAMLGSTGYLHSLDYARNRPQGRSIGPAGKDPASPQVKLVEHADVRRMLLAQKAYVEGAIGLNLYCARLVDEELSAADDNALKQASLLLEILTPIAKSWPSKWCLHANDLAIQIHGGYGYTREYNVEQFYRDNRLNPIHEGTDGIHGMDLLGRKVVMQDGAAFKLLGQRIGTAIRRAIESGHPEQEAQAQALDAAMKRLATVTQALWQTGDPQLTLANATIYLEAFGHIVLSWIWLEQAIVAAAALAKTEKAEGDEASFYQGKLAAARYFFHWELPKTGPQFDLLASLDRTTLDMQDAWF
ncbi:acyl-CoA dehydrogenase [Paraburkholderia megapolitana]|uniref:acyl-CoA dehydrogenase n=1 Tax=Paraburkholderia megapolitana TaxID=420953 RepID=UPI0038BB785B